MVVLVVVMGVGLMVELPESSLTLTLRPPAPALLLRSLSTLRLLGLDFLDSFDKVEDSSG